MVSLRFDVRGYILDRRRFRNRLYFDIGVIMKQLSELIEAGQATLAHNARPDGWRIADFGTLLVYVAPEAGEVIGEVYPDDESC